MFTYLAYLGQRYKNIFIEQKVTPSEYIFCVKFAS